MEKYVFRKHSGAYSSLFDLERKKLIKILPLAKIEHVGSTAVPGLGGKGIVDIAVGVKGDSLKVAKSVLEDNGYDFREKASYPARLFFRRDYPYREGQRRVHLHLVLFNKKDWCEMIGFRDYLLGNPDVIKEYAKVKKEAVLKAQGDGEKYRKYKEKFIEKIILKIKARN